ncbi:MAG: hypothetical protein ACI93R_002018 [Flavobacteriales bacterium]|jgi:hypothetical protein
MLENSFFYFIFVGQLLLMSFFLPREVIRRANFVLDNYPAHEYPKLYLQPESVERRLLSRFKLVNTLILAVGLIALAAIVVWDVTSTGAINEGFPIFCAIVQWLPLFYLELLAFKRLKAMRKMNTEGQRKASIVPRNISSFISPWIIVLAAFALAGYIVFEILLGEQQPNFGGFVNIFAALASNVVYLGVILWSVYGKKLNPFQSTDERHRQIGLTVNVLVFTSIVSSAYMLTNGLLEHFLLHHFRVVFNSVYVQVITLMTLGLMLKSTRVEDIDFSVYKESK